MKHTKDGIRKIRHFLAVNAADVSPTSSWRLLFDPQCCPPQCLQHPYLTRRLLIRFFKTTTGPSSQNCMLLSHYLPDPPMYSRLPGTCCLLPYI